MLAATKSKLFLVLVFVISVATACNSGNQNDPDNGSAAAKAVNTVAGTGPILAPLIRCDSRRGPTDSDSSEVSSLKIQFDTRTSGRIESLSPKLYGTEYRSSPGGEPSIDLPTGGSSFSARKLDLSIRQMSLARSSEKPSFTIDNTKGGLISTEVQIGDPVIKDTANWVRSLVWSGDTVTLVLENGTSIDYKKCTFNAGNARKLCDGLNKLSNKVNNKTWCLVEK